MQVQCSQTNVDLLNQSISYLTLPHQTHQRTVLAIPMGICPTYTKEITLPTPMLIMLTHIIQLVQFIHFTQFVRSVCALRVLHEALQHVSATSMS